MATIVNNPQSGGNDGGGAGLVLGIIVIIILLVLFFVYALPAIRNRGGAAPSGNTGGTNINVTVPTPSTGGNTGGSSSNGY